MFDTASLADRIDRIAGDNARLIVAIAGAPGSGKSSYAAALKATLDRRNRALGAMVVPMDGFHLDNAILDANGWRARKGAAHSFDIAGFDALLARLAEPGPDPIYIPLFDRARDLSVNAAMAIAAENRVLLVEGNYLLLDAPGWRGLRAHFDLTVMLVVPEAELERRLMRRWLDLGLSREAATAKVAGNDLLNARQVIAQSTHADIQINNDGAGG